MHKIKKDGMTFLVSDNKAILEKFTDYNSESLIIPSKIIVNEQTYTVDEVMENAFNNQNLILKHVSIPNSISKIGDRAFYNLKTLERVEFEKDSKLCEIGNFAFSALENLEKFNIPESVNTIGNCTFRNTVGIPEIHISKNLTQIGSSAFVGMTNLEKICCDSENPIYSSLNGVLFSKKKFKLIFYPPSKEDLVYSVPRGTTTIEFSSFRDSVNIEVINMPNSVKKICSNAFKFSSKLIKLVFEPGNEIPGINNFSFNDANILIEIESKSETELRKTGYFIINNVKSINKIIFPKYIEFIHDFMFCNAINLKEVEFEQGSELKEIGSNAFENAKSLTRIKLPRKLEKISDYAFRGNLSLKEVEFEEGSELKEIGSNVYENARSLTRIKLPRKLEKIPNYAFCGALSLKKVEFEEGSELKEIGSNAFENAESLSRIKIPKSIEVIADNAFYGTGNLHKIDLDKGNSFEEEIKDKQPKYDSVPDWLLSAIKGGYHQGLPLKELLEDSLFYPCSGYDTRPIYRLHGHIFSYVYVDLGIYGFDYHKWIKSSLKYGNEFRELNCSLVKESEIGYTEIFPYSSWFVPLRPNRNDGNFEQYKAQKESISSRNIYWSIWKNNDIKCLTGYKPMYFSLLFIRGVEMNVVYQRLYNRLNIRPKVISIINPGMGFWDVKQVNGESINHSFFAKVLRKNASGFPPYLFGSTAYSVLSKYYEVNENDWHLCSYKLKELNY